MIQIQGQGKRVYQAGTKNRNKREKKKTEKEKKVSKNNN